MKRLLLLLPVLWAGLVLSQNEGDPFKIRVARELIMHARLLPQEKVYLHADRDHYNAGEKVWFRAYLVNAITHKQENLSRFVYVELLDRQDSVRSRIKVTLRDSVYAGYMPLSSELPQGDYYLRAYTYWMQNAGDDYILRKKIRVVNALDTKVQTTIAYENDKGGEMARIHFSNSRQEVYGKVFVDYIQNGKLKTERTDEKGDIRIKLDSASYKKPLLLRFKDEAPFTFERWVHLVNPKKDFDVAFFPEGGNLLAGNDQTVAFKAIGTNGLSCDVKGEIYNAGGVQVNWVQSLHYGMGGFELSVDPGQRYYALFSGSDGVQKRFELPAPTHYGLALKVVVYHDVLGYTILSGDSTQLPEDLHILIHSGGVPLLCHPVEGRRKGKIALEKISEGILHLVLMDAKGEVYSQRLCFVRKERPELEFRTDKPYYNIRDLVNLRMAGISDSVAWQGSFSLAVTDDSKCERDSAADNILSALLLTSDLKGYIEAPGYYFRDDRVMTRRYLDLLLMTQGWTRFDVSEVAFGKYPQPGYYMERGQAISGKVKNFWGKDAGDANLILFSTSGIVRMVNADSTGHFVIDGIAFPDSTSFLVQARSKKGRRSVEVAMDKDEFLKLSRRIPYDEKTQAEEDDFYKKFQRDYYYDRGVKVYVLDEAVVKRRIAPRIYSFYDSMADYNLDSAKLASMGDMDIRLALQEIPGVDFWGDSLMRMGKTLYVLVNDMVEELSYIAMLQPRDLVSISLLRPPLSVAMFGNVAENGALIITTNPHFVPRDAPRLNMAQFSLLGYQKKAEFYMPHYEVDSVRLALADSLDTRTTVYWNPDVRMDAEGKVNCFFTTSDSEGPYSVIMEGILRDGTICRKEGKVNLKFR